MLTGSQRKYLEEHSNYFNAPYGICSGIVPFGKGKIREIGFGVARYLDASIRIYSPNKITVRGQGGLSYKFEGDFNGVQSLKEHFIKALPNANPME